MKFGQGGRDLQCGGLACQSPDADDDGRDGVSRHPEVRSGREAVVENQVGGRHLLDQERQGHPRLSQPVGVFRTCRIGECGGRRCAGSGGGGCGRIGQRRGCRRCGCRRCGCCGGRGRGGGCRGLRGCRCLLRGGRRGRCCGRIGCDRRGRPEVATSIPVDDDEYQNRHEYQAQDYLAQRPSPHTRPLRSATRVPWPAVQALSVRFRVPKGSGGRSYSRNRAGWCQSSSSRPAAASGPVL
ncbi:MAG: hypothetical protein F4X74_00480 [Acidimicrobiia bacterium]|nr:hypothetical protein [Acidimicrobiia bacterium]